MASGHVWRIEIKGSCRKKIERAPEHIQAAVDDALADISADPFHHTHIKPLLGRKNYYRYRIGSYRLIYLVDKVRIVVVAVDFSPRGDAYK